MKSALTLSLVLLGFSACSYRMSQPPAQVKLPSGEIVENPRVFVPVVDNTSAIAAGEAVMTSSLRDKLQEIPGLSVVNRKEDANLVLLGNITNFTRSRSQGSAVGDQVSEEEGGPKVESLIATGVVLNVTYLFTLLYPDPELNADRVLWTRQFEEEIEYVSSDRYTYPEASTAAPFINYSREKLRLRQLSESVATKVLDQVRQDF